MTKQDEIAEMLYLTHCLFVKQKLPPWEGLRDEQMAYWYMLADGVLELLEYPDEKMIHAALTEIKKPATVDKKSWDEHQITSFLRYWQAAINAGKNNPYTRD